MSKFVDKSVIMYVLDDKASILRSIKNSYYRRFIGDVVDFISDKSFEYVSEDSTTYKCMGDCQLLFLGSVVYYNDKFYELTHSERAVSIILEYYYYMLRTYLGRTVTLRDKDVEKLKIIAYCCCFSQEVKNIERFVQTNEFKCMIYRTEFMSDVNKLSNRIDDERIIEADVEYRIISDINIAYISYNKASKHFVFDKESCKFVGLNTKVRKEYESKVEVFKELAL